MELARRRPFVTGPCLVLHYRKQDTFEVDSPAGKAGPFPVQSGIRGKPLPRPIFAGTPLAAPERDFCALVSVYRGRTILLPSPRSSPVHALGLFPPPLVPEVPGARGNLV